MKTEIVTFYWSNNYGALLQAVTLKEYLKKFHNQDVSFNNYLPKKLIYKENISQLNRNNLKFILIIIKKKYLLYKWKLNIAKFDKPNLNYNKKDIDLYIYGSDEIWNYTSPFTGFDPFFFGKGNDKKKISYAASLGNASLKNTNYLDEIKNCLKKFTHISVRDDNTQKFVKYCININPKIVLDPCFLCTPDFISGENPKIKNLSSQKYILIYGNYFTNNDISKIIEFSKKNEMNLISTGFYNKWSDKNILNCDPNDFIYLVKNSEFVFTSMFHGVMLSYKYKKNFWISQDPYRSNKLNYFVNYLDLANRYIDVLGKIEIDYNLNRNKFEDWLSISKNFLTKSLSDK